MMADVRSILDEDKFFADTADTPKESVEQHKKPECLKGAINKDKVLGDKKQWTHEEVDKANYKTIDKTYAEYKQRKLNEKVKKLEQI